MDHMCLVVLLKVDLSSLLENRQQTLSSKDLSDISIPNWKAKWVIESNYPLNVFVWNCSKFCIFQSNRNFESQICIIICLRNLYLNFCKSTQFGNCLNFAIIILHIRKYAARTIDVISDRNESHWIKEYEISPYPTENMVTIA